MLPVIYKQLCSVCRDDLTSSEIQKGRCEKTGRPFYSVYTNREEEELKEFLNRVLGRPRAVQLLWLRRIVRGESFAAVAPTGIGKTAFGIATSVFFGQKGKRCYIIVPTTLLVRQTVESIERIAEKAQLVIGKNEKKGLTVAFYEGRMKKEDKERFQQRLRERDFDILVTTTQFLSKHFHDLSGLSFHFIFVDDVDSVLKNSKNVDYILHLMGFRKDHRGWTGTTESILMVSTATAQKGRASQVFRELLNFDVGSSFHTVRNIEDIVIGSESIEDIKDLLRRMGSGGVIFTRGVKEAEHLYNTLKEEFRISLTVSGRDRDFEAFRNRETEYLIGTASYYGSMVRGLDLPERIRYAVFVGVPVFSIEYKELTPKLLKTLAFSLRRHEEIKKYLPIIWNIEKHPDKMESLKQRIKELSKKGVVEDIVIQGERIIFPDIKTYIQGSGRCSRLTAYGLTKGASFVFEEDPKVLEAFMKKASYYDIQFRGLEEIDLQRLAEEIDISRIKKRHTEEFLKPALFIVESPTKAKMIARFFGKPSIKFLRGLVVYEVATEGYILIITACIGHLVDLVTDRGFHGVIVNKEFIPVYTTIKRCKNCNYQFTHSKDRCPHCGEGEINDSMERIESIRRLAADTGLVIIGTDPDPEGEKIAWDIHNLTAAVAEVRRAEFHEVTPRAIKDALRRLKNVDNNLVKAQVVRRVEDRWIGFVLSQILWSVFMNKGLSAGRVQTPVLQWIILHEERFRKRKKIAFVPELSLEIEGTDEEEIQLSIELLHDSRHPQQPLPPYTTDEMLKDANRILKFDADLTMRTAQDLYENGLITYHRTDSTYVSDVGRRIASEYLGEDFKGRQWKAEEGAHECIRPTRAWDRTMLQKALLEGIISAEDITTRHLSLYELVFRRFMASQCREYILRKARYRIIYKDREILEERVLEAEGRAFELYRSVDIKPPLPLGKIHTKVTIKTVPEGYPLTQADVIRLMKERGIGRPSTYATIITKLFDRDYISKSRNWLFSTPNGRRVYEFLSKHYREFVSEERTRILYERIDLIEKGMAAYDETLKEIYGEIMRAIENSPLRYRQYISA